jgi:hypothetical protein
MGNYRLNVRSMLVNFLLHDGASITVGEHLECGQVDWRMLQQARVLHRKTTIVIYFAQSTNYCGVSVAGCF